MMDPSENPNNYDDYRMLKLGYVCEAFAADCNAAFESILKPVMNWIEKVLEKFRAWVKETVAKFWNYLRRVCGKSKTRKLIRLALYAKKSRVRKKNLHRLQKIIK